MNNKKTFRDETILPVKIIDGEEFIWNPIKEMYERYVGSLREKLDYDYEMHRAAMKGDRDE